MNAANPSSSICRYMNPVNVTDNVNLDVVVFVLQAVSGDWSKDVVKVVRISWSKVAAAIGKWIFTNTVFGPTPFQGHGSLAPHLQHQRTPRPPRDSKDSLEVFFGETRPSGNWQPEKKSIKILDVHPTSSLKRYFKTPPTNAYTFTGDIPQTPPWPINPTPKSTD